MMDFYNVRAEVIQLLQRRVQYRGLLFFAEDNIRLA
jgi:hypothetical protein